MPVSAFHTWHYGKAKDLRVDLSEARVRKELAEEEGRRIKEGGVALHETPAAVFVQMGLELEEAQ